MRSRVILTLFLTAALAVTTSTAHAAPTLQQQYLDIFLKLNDAQHLNQQGDYIGALDDFEDCYKKLARIHDTNPDWESALVVHRMADCQKMIIDLRPKADEQAQAKATKANAEAVANAIPVPPPVIAPPAPPNVVTPNPPPAAVTPTPTPSNGNGNSEEVSSLKLQLKAVTEELNITKERLKESQAQLETYRVQLQAVNEQLADLKSKQTVDDKMGKLLSENKSLNDKLAAAQKELTDLKSNPTSKLAMAQKALANLQGEYEESQAANKALIDTTTTLKEQLDKASADLVAANQKLATAGTSSPEYATLKHENEMMREILTRELQEQAHRDMAKRLAQEEFDNLKLKSKVLQEQLDILGSPMTPASSDEERSFLQSLRTSSPEVSQTPGNSFSAPANGTTPAATTNTATTNTATTNTATTNTAAATPPLIAAPADTNTAAAPPPPAVTVADTTTNTPAVTIAMNNPPADATAAPAATNAAPDGASAAPNVGSSNAATTTPAIAPTPPPTPDVSVAPTNPPATTGTPDGSAPTTTKLPPAQTTVTDTTITHGDNSAQTQQPDPTTYSTKARLPDDMRDTAQDAADLFKNQKYDESAAKYQTIIDKYPESLYAWSNLGVVRFQQGKFNDALIALQQAVKLSPTDAFSYSNLGIVYYQLGQYENAIDALTKAEALDPNDAKTHNYLGCACSQKGWQEAAEKEFRKAIAIDPNFGDAHFNLALVYATSKPPSLELARREYNRALELGIGKDSRLEKLLASNSSGQ